MITNGRYFLDDPESGRMYEVSKERYDQYHAMWDAMMERMRNMTDVAKERKGLILITSTPSDDNNSDEFYKQIWETKK